MKPPQSNISERPSAGWFTLSVMRTGARGWDWCALMIEVHPEDLRHRLPGTTRETWLRIPGKHKSKKSARAGLEDMMATRH
jgi:hypothetical protein